MLLYDDLNLSKQTNFNKQMNPIHDSAQSETFYTVLPWQDSLLHIKENVTNNFITFLKSVLFSANKLLKEPFLNFLLTAFYDLKKCT